MSAAGAELVLKVCVLGSCKSGKTLLCQTLAQQSSSGEYAPTAGVRVQILGRQVGQEHVQVQLWDCAGDAQYQPAWPVLAHDLDGVLLIIDPDHPEQERELEQFYLTFAQPHKLTLKQCCVLAVSRATDAHNSWSGLQGKLSKLPSGHVHISSSTDEPGRKAAAEVLDRLLAGCVVQKKDRIERAALAVV